MLDALAETLGVSPSIDDTVWESLALANTFTGFAMNRRYAWHSVGLLGITELTAPWRSAHVAKGLKRLGLSERERRYFALHAHIDVKHSKDWNDQVLKPLIAEDPSRARWIAEGALARMVCAQRAFERYRSEFGLLGQPPERKASGAKRAKLARRDGATPGQPCEARIDVTDLLRDGFHNRPSSTAAINPAISPCINIGTARSTRASSQFHHAIRRSAAT